MLLCSVSIAACVEKINVMLHTYKKTAVDKKPTITAGFICIVFTFSETVIRIKQNAKQYSRSQFQRPRSFVEATNFLKWVAMQRCLTSDNLEKMWKSGVLSEELAHTDAMRFFQAVQQRAFLEGVDGEDLRFAKTLIKKDSPLRTLLNHENSQTVELFAEALIETEAKLLSIAHSNFPSYSFTDDVLTIIYPEVASMVNHQPQYLVCSKILEEEFRSEFKLNNLGEWKSFLFNKLVKGSIDSEKQAISDFNQELREAALRIHQRHFYTNAERKFMVPGWTTYEAPLTSRGV